MRRIGDITLRYGKVVCDYLAKRPRLGRGCGWPPLISTEEHRKKIMIKSAVPRLRLSVLHQSPISEGSTLGAALRNSIDLAALAESLGYHRYWVAEHHGSPDFGCMS